MHVITIATDENNWLNNWKSSAQKWGYQYSILGKGLEWKGFSTKIKLIIEFLLERDPEEIIAIVDAYDLLFTGPPAELYEKFISFNFPIVVGGEDVCILNCHKHTCKVNNNRYKWVNGGCVIGYTKELISAYEFALQVSPEDDQIGVAKYMDANPDKIVVDGNQMIVANIRSTDELKYIDNNRFRHTITKQVPVIIHTPFMYSDLGSRSEMVRKHALDSYKSPKFGTYLLGFFSHTYKHVTKNPAYSIIFYSIIIFIVLLVIFIIWCIM